MVVHLRGALHGQFHLAALRRKLHGIAQDVDEHLPQLHLVADVVIVDRRVDMAVISQALVVALSAEHRIDGFQQFREGEFLVLEGHPAGFDAGHVQNVVDEPQQVIRGISNLLQIALRLFRRIRIV